MNWIRTLFFKSPFLTGFIAFLLALGVGIFLSVKDFQIERMAEEKEVRQTTELIEERIQEVVSTLNTHVNILAYLFKTEQIDADFDEVAQSIIGNVDLIDQIQVLDSGVIVASYPLVGNESILGYDILKDPLRREEAIMAIEQRTLRIAGPFTLRQGGEAIIGRLPLFEEDEFVGFAAVIVSWEKFKKKVFGNEEFSNSAYTIGFFKDIPSTEQEINLLESDFTNADGPVSEIRIPEGNWIVRVQLTESNAWLAILPRVIFRTFFAFLIWFLVHRFSREPHVLTKKVNEMTQELQLSNQRFKLASQATAEIIWDWDIENNRTFRSENFEKVFGYSMEESISNDTFWKSIVHPDDIGAVVQNLEQTLSGDQEIWSQVFRVKNAKGDYLFIVDKGIIIRDSSGKAIRMIGSTQDITERTIAKMELANEKERLSNVIEGTQAGTWEWNVQTGETIFNEAWAGIIGYTLDELEPISFNTWVEHAHPDDLKESNRLLELHFDNKSENYEIECRMRHKNGHWKWVFARGKVLSWTPEGKPLMMFGTYIDISEKKQREEELKMANQRLKAANEELKSFASVASHDMKEPLRMISSFLALLEKRYQPVLDEKGKQYINFAVDGARRLSILVEDMMQYAKIGFDDELLDRVNLNALISEVLNIKLDGLGQEQPVVNVGHLPDVVAIKTPIKTVFLNLISNAIKYRQKDRRLMINIYSKPVQDHIQITVEDNGIGIEQEYFQKIFGLFSRLHPKNEYTGVGLGLAVCKKIIAQHGGKIWLESAPGKGSKFHLTLKKA